MTVHDGSLQIREHSRESGERYAMVYYIEEEDQEKDARGPSGTGDQQSEEGVPLLSNISSEGSGWCVGGDVRSMSWGGGIWWKGW